MTDPLLSSAVELAASLRAGRLSARELLEMTLARIAAVNPALNAVVHLAAESARAAALDAERRFAAGEARPLEGLPVTIKDAFDVTGMVSTAGSPAFKDRVPAVDAAAVARLRQAGAIILGKTNVPVFSGDFQSFNAHCGVTNNPWDVTRSPGGSSGGAAVAVATGMSAFELGTDLGGSIRWPAHATGVYGLKTSWGLVSTWGTVPPPPDRRLERNAELVVAGPMARSAADLDLLLPILAGPRDPATPSPALTPPRRSDPRGLRVALWLDEPMAPVDDAVSAAVREAARLLAADGAIVDERARPAIRFEELFEVYALLNHAIVAYALPPKLRDRLALQAKSFAPGDLSHRALQARAVRMSPGLYADVNARRQKLRRLWARFFEGVDVVLCPPAPVVAIPHDHAPDIHARTLDVNGAPRPYLDFLHWAAPATGADLPAAAAPVMLTPGGLPAGVQIIGPMGEDRTVIAVAAMLERLTGGFRAPPGLG